MISSHPIPCEIHRKEVVSVAWQWLCTGTAHVQNISFQSHGGVLHCFQQEAGFQKGSVPRVIIHPCPDILDPNVYQSWRCMSHCLAATHRATAHRSEVATLVAIQLLSWVPKERRIPSCDPTWQWKIHYWVRIETPISSGFSIARFDYRRVHSVSFTGCYGKSAPFIGKSFVNGSCSIAMLSDQGVSHQ